MTDQPNKTFTTSSLENAIAAHNSGQYDEITWTRIKTTEELKNIYGPEAYSELQKALSHPVAHNHNLPNYALNGYPQNAYTGVLGQSAMRAHPLYYQRQFYNGQNTPACVGNEDVQDYYAADYGNTKKRIAVYLILTIALTVAGILWGK